MPRCRFVLAAAAVALLALPRPGTAETYRIAGLRKGNIFHGGIISVASSETARISVANVTDEKTCDVDLSWVDSQGVVVNQQD